MHWEASAPHMWSEPYVNQSRPRCTTQGQGWVGANHHNDNQLVNLYLNQRGFRSILLGRRTSLGWRIILSKVCSVDSRLRFGIRTLKCLQEGSWESWFITFKVCLKGKSQERTRWDRHSASPSCSLNAISKPQQKHWSLFFIWNGSIWLHKQLFMMVEAISPTDLAQWLRLQGTGSGSQRGSGCGPRIGTWRCNYGTKFQLGLMKGYDTISRIL